MLHSCTYSSLQVSCGFVLAAMSATLSLKNVAFKLNLLPRIEPKGQKLALYQLSYMSIQKKLESQLTDNWTNLCRYKVSSGLVEM